MVKITVEKDGELLFTQECRLAIVHMQELKDEEDSNLLNIAGEAPGALHAYLKLIRHVVKAILSEIKDPEMRLIAIRGVMDAIEGSVRESTQADDTDEDALENKPIPLYHS